MTRTIQQLFDLQGKTALVTGGSRGLGLQMAHALGEAGARIMLSSRKAADLEEATAELQAAGIDARWIAADCASEDDIRRVGDEALQRLGDIDILVTHACAAWGARRWSAWATSTSSSTTRVPPGAHRPKITRSTPGTRS